LLRIAKIGNAKNIVPVSARELLIVWPFNGTTADFSPELAVFERQV
jgi:hypothetical protein